MASQLRVLYFVAQHRDHGGCGLQSIHGSCLVASQLSVFPTPACVHAHAVTSTHIEGVLVVKGLMPKVSLRDPIPRMPLERRGVRATRHGATCPHSSHLKLSQLSHERKRPSVVSGPVQPGMNSAKQRRKGTEEI